MKKPKLAIVCILMLYLCLVVGISATMPANAVEFAGIFDNDRYSQNLLSFPKWVRVKTQHPKDKTLIGNPCMAMGTACFMNDWKDFLSGIQNDEPMEQIQKVNARMNASDYVTDLANWGVDNYWETPLEFFIHSGNCKDYAIAKFYSLRELGFSNDDLRIVILMDENINTLHAVLVVNLDGEELVLDNQVKQIVSSSKVYHYNPIYAVNEAGWWRYQ